MTEFEISAPDVLGRLAEAVTIIGPDGVHAETNAASRAILDGLRERAGDLPISEVSWGSVDTDGRPLPTERLPAEITRLTGEECTGIVVGFPGAVGDTVWLRISTRRMTDEGPPFGVIVTFVDVSESRRTLLDLERQRARYQAVVESLHECVVIEDAAGRIVAANARAQELLGAETDQLAACEPPDDPGWCALYPDGTPWPAADQPSARVRATGVAQLDVLMGLRKPDGSERWLSVNATPLHDFDGSLAGVAVTFVDETGALHDRQELVAATRLFSTAFADAPSGMALVALDGRLIRVNRSLCVLLGYTEDELLARTFQEITHPDDLDADLEHVARLVAGVHDRYSMEKRYFTSGGEEIWASLHVSLVRDDDGTPQHFISQVEDISERKALEETLQRLADHDALTDLWNRRRFEEELERQVGRCRRYGEPAALFLLDLDDFKRVNDTLGHKAGDDVLRAVAGAMRGRLRSTDSLARLGGDEFALLLPRVTPSQAGLLAGEVAQALRTTPVTVRDREVTPTASIGVAFIDETVQTGEAALVAADIAMYRAKAAGGDRTSVEPADAS